MGGMFERLMTHAGGYAYGGDDGGGYGDDKLEDVFPELLFHFLDGF